LNHYGKATVLEVDRAGCVRLVGNPHLGITSGLPVIRPQPGELDSFTGSPSASAMKLSLRFAVAETSLWPPTQQEPKKDLWLVLSSSASPDIAAIRLMLNRRAQP